MTVRWTLCQKRAFLDGELHSVINGLRPRQTVKIEAVAQDDMHRKWRSYAVFSANEHGVIDVGHMAPIEGTYAGTDANGLLWSMLIDSDKDEGPLVYFMKNDHTAHTLTFRLWSVERSTERTTDRVTDRTDGRINDQVCDRTIDRIDDWTDDQIADRLLMEKRISFPFLTEGTDVTPIDDPFSGIYFRPSHSEREPLPAVLVLGGSPGGLWWSEQMAALLSSHGYAALAVAYFDWQNKPGLPAELADIPVEYIHGALQWLKKHPEVDPNRTGVMGISKGAELSLLIASMYPEDVRAVVCYAPGAYVFEGILRQKGDRKKSSWSKDGKPLAFVPYPGEPMYWSSNKVHLRGLHEEAVKIVTEEVRSKARIPVERIQCPLFMLTGEKDGTWPAAAMAQEIESTMIRAGRGYEVRRRHFDHAGHLADIPNFPVLPERAVALQEAAKAARYALRDSVAFLKKHL